MLQWYYRGLLQGHMCKPLNRLWNVFFFLPHPSCCSSLLLIVISFRVSSIRFFHIKTFCVSNVKIWKLSWFWKVLKLLWKSDFSSFRILEIWLTVEPMVFFYDLFFVHKKTCIVRERVLSECSESTRYASFFSFCNLVSQYIVIKCFPECLKLLHLTFFRVLSPFSSSWSVSL